jgi:hypothetical protein
LVIALVAALVAANASAANAFANTIANGHSQRHCQLHKNPNAKNGLLASQTVQLAFGYWVQVVPVPLPTQVLTQRPMLLPTAIAQTP